MVDINCALSAMLISHCLLLSAPQPVYTPLSGGGWRASSGQHDVGHEGVATGRGDLSLYSLSALRGLTYASHPRQKEGRLKAGFAPNVGIPL